MYSCRLTAARMEACKLSSSEIHNMRMKSLDYVRDDLTRLNESRVLERISDRMRGIRELYLKTFGQQLIMYLRDLLSSFHLPI